MRYLVTRVASVVPTLLLVSAAIFWMMRILPGDVATLILIGPDGTGSPRPEQIAALRTALGLDRPMIVQYLDWLSGLIRLDVGRSLWTGKPAFAELFRRLPLTLMLGTLAMMFSMVLALPLGILAAVKRGTWIDYVARTFSLAGLSIPNFFIGVLIILALVTFFGWTAPLGYASPFENPWTSFQQLSFPALVLGYNHSALLTRLIRSSLLEVMRQDYIRTARSKGLREIDVIIRHALKNSMLPVITVVGLGLAEIIGGTVIIETVFTLPGVGRLVVQAITLRDYPLVQLLVFVFAFSFALVNLLVDLFYAVLDPRIQLS